MTTETIRAVHKAGHQPTRLDGLRQLLDAGVRVLLTDGQPSQTTVYYPDQASLHASPEPCQKDGAPTVPLQPVLIRRAMEALLSGEIDERDFLAIIKDAGAVEFTFNLLQDEVTFVGANGNKLIESIPERRQTPTRPHHHSFAASSTYHPWGRPQAMRTTATRAS